MSVCFQIIFELIFGIQNSLKSSSTFGVLDLRFPRITFVALVDLNSISWIRGNARPMRAYSWTSQLVSSYSKQPANNSKLTQFSMCWSTVSIEVIRIDRGVSSRKFPRVSHVGIRKLRAGPQKSLMRTLLFCDESTNIYRTWTQTVILESSNALHISVQSFNIAQSLMKAFVARFCSRPVIQQPIAKLSRLSKLNEARITSRSKTSKT